MALQDMENSVLFQLQQPGATFSTAPTWSSLSNPQLGQATADFFINDGYRQVLADTWDIGLALVTQTFNSTLNTYAYQIPATGSPVYPKVMKLQRVFYRPNAQNYTAEFAAGTSFISWDRFQSEYTAQGYLTQTAFGTVPTVAALNPDRKTLYFYPGSASAGDVITIMYTPFPTVGATVCPTLVNPTDQTILPDDCEEAIVQWALSKCWMKERQLESARFARGAYENEIKKLRSRYIKTTRGDTFRILPWRGANDCLVS